MKDDVRISKLFTVGDWKTLRPKLVTGKADWSEGFKIFEGRIQSRFLIPIKNIKSKGKNSGEGFSIVLISVVLFEFLAAFDLGKKYNHEIKGPNEYSSSANLFVNFFKKSILFNSGIKNREAKDNFYKNIRCGLVHEARTKGNDVIISKSSHKNTIPEYFYFKVDGEYRLNRDLLLELLKKHIDKYKLEIINNVNGETRKYFLMKMDELAGIEHVWYFIYGSNLYENQLLDRLSDFSDTYLLKKRCCLDNYMFKYDKKSSDGTAKANLLKKERSVTQGIAVLIKVETLDCFIKKYEIGYEKRKVYISIVGVDEEIYQPFEAFTCISDIHTKNNPSDSYVSKIIKGAIENELPKDYIENYLKNNNAPISSICSNLLT